MNGRKLFWVVVITAISAMIGVYGAFHPKTYADDASAKAAAKSPTKVMVFMRSSLEGSSACPELENEINDFMKTHKVESPEVSISYNYGGDAVVTLVYSESQNESLYKVKIVHCHSKNDLKGLTGNLNNALAAPGVEYVGHAQDSSWGRVVFVLLYKQN